MRPGKKGGKKGETRPLLKGKDGSNMGRLKGGVKVRIPVQGPGMGKKKREKNSLKVGDEQKGTRACPKKKRFESPNSAIKKREGEEEPVKSRMKRNAPHANRVPALQEKKTGRHNYFQRKERGGEGVR